MAKRTKKTKPSIKETTVASTVEKVEKEDTMKEVPMSIKQPTAKSVIKTPVTNEVVSEISETSKEAANIIKEALKATEKTSIRIQKPIVVTPVSAKVEEPKSEIKENVDVKEKVKEVKEPEKEERVNMYDLFLGRYCKAVTEYRNGISKKRPINSFISLMDYVIRTSNIGTYTDMLKFFTLEQNGMMANVNTLNGIETINDPASKTKVMTIFTVFHGLAVQRSTGKRPTFSVNAIRSIVKNEKFTNWVNSVMNS